MSYKKRNIKQRIALIMVMLMVSTSIYSIPVQAAESKKNQQEEVSVGDGKETLSFEEELSTIDENLDSDKDGLVDLLEKTFKTNPEKSDTDGDGLSDYIELILALNPLIKDTDGNGIEDGLEDTDQDELSNLEEIKASTDYAKKDTDGDGLLDGKEIKVNHTSPILEDTDGDTLTDGDEILLKLNPLKASSNEVTHDSKRKVQQSLSNKRIADSLKKNTNLFVPSLSGAVSRVMDKEVFLEEYDNDGFHKNRAIIGKPVQIKTSFKNENQLLLNFDYSNFLNQYDESAMDMLTICQFVNDELIPLETKKDKNNKSLKANISGEG
ncbi:MAG: lipase class 3, partial [Neobacillus sp.]|nr:lipase class 3 [Neobacillus sp.]